MANEYDISRAFKRIENDLIDSMMRNLKRHRAEEDELGIKWEQWQALQLKELERYRAKNRDKFAGEFGDINQRISDMLTDTYNTAQTEEEARVLDKIRKGDFRPIQTKDTTFFNLNDDKLNILLERTKADFTRAEYAVLRKADDAYRKVIFDAQVYANVTNDYNKAVDMATHDFLKSGLQSIQYKNGARHNIADYARMAIRTTNKRAYLMGEGNARDSYGIHTVRVNKRTQACPLCVGYLGKVLIDDVYGGGTAKEASEKGVPTLSSAMQAGFLHPNCKDIYSTYIDGVSKPATPWTQEEIDEIVGDYNKEQAIQHAVDMQASYARMAKYALDSDNQAKYQARADQWQTRVDELQGKPIEPVEPPIANVASQATPITPVSPIINSEEAEIRQRIADIKARGIGNKLSEAEREYEVLKDYYDTYGNIKASAEAFNEDVSQRLLEQAEKYRKKQESSPSKMFADFEKKYRYINDHLKEFEDGTYADDVKARIKDLKKQAKAWQKELDTEYDALEDIIGAPNVSKLGAYKEKNTNAIKHFLDDAPTEYRNLWNEFADNFNTLSGGGGSKAYYSPALNGVKLSINSASKGSTYQTPYQVVFHEYGHALDWEMNRKYGNGNRIESFTQNYKDGIFGKTIQKEANDALEKFARERGLMSTPNKGTVVTDADKMVRRGLLKQEEKAEWIRTQMQTVQIDRIEAEKQFCKYIKDKYDIYQRTDISDMFESVMTTTDYPFGVGHGKKYWGSKGNSYKNCGQEAFAEMYSAVIANDRSWEVIKEFFPESVKIFNEIIEVAKL